jgi:hypothetical protein
VKSPGFNNNPLQSLVMRGIEFEIVWGDPHGIEYEVVCANGSFTGSAKMYLNHDDLQNAADSLSGFPTSITDRREIELGQPESKMAGPGGMRISFHCVDSVGHAVAFVKLWADGWKGFSEPQSVSLYVPVEAGAIDSFVKQARSIRDKGAKAYLHMADHTLGWVRKTLA